MDEKVQSHPYNMILLPVGRINVNHGYQRGEVPSTVKEMVGDFDYHKVNPIKCTHRDGNYYAFDGQNTAIGLTLLFGGQYKAPVMIYNDLDTVEDEAKLFEEINSKKYRKAITVADMWKSQIFRGEKTPTHIRQIVTDNGLELANGQNNGKTGVIPSSLFKCLETIYKQYGPTTFEETVIVFTRAWKRKKAAYNVPLLKGLALFIETYFGDYSRADLVNRLMKTDVDNLIVSCKKLSEPGYKKYARAIVTIYNYRTSTGRLPMKL